MQKSSDVTNRIIKQNISTNEVGDIFVYLVYVVLSKIYNLKGKNAKLSSGVWI